MTLEEVIGVAARRVLRSVRESPHYWIAAAWAACLIVVIWASVTGPS